MLFSWSPANLEHIAKHGVTPEETEWVILHAARPWPMRTGDKFVVWGPTPANRLLHVLFVLLEDQEIDPTEVDVSRLGEDEAVAMVIHARELTAVERGRYRRMPPR